MKHSQTVFVLLSVMLVWAALPAGAAEGEGSAGASGALEGAAGPVAGQPPPYAFGLTLAPVFRAARDDLLVPLAFQGAGLEIQARYQHHLGPGLLTSALDVGAAFVVERYLHPGLTLEHGLHLGYLWLLPTRGDGSLALGPVVGVGTDALYPDSWDDAHLYWLGAGWAGVGLEHTRPLRAGWRLRLSTDLALAGLVSRPPVYRQEKQDPLNRVSFHLFGTHAGSTLEGPGTFQRARLAVDFERSKGDRHRQRAIGLEAQFVRAADPAPAFAFQTSIRFSLGWGR